jgi:hypothetical protein
VSRQVGIVKKDKKLRKKLNDLEKIGHCGDWFQIFVTRLSPVLVVGGPPPQGYVATDQSLIALTITPSFYRKGQRNL